MPEMTGGRVWAKGDRSSPLPDGTESAIKQQLGLTGNPVYLMVGGIEPKKNSLALLKSFTEFLRPDQALLIDPQDAAAIAEGMLQILQPQTAQALVEASRSILPHYSWVTSAKMHLDPYRQLL